FAEKLGEWAIIKDRTITLLVEFVPLTFNAEGLKDIAVAKSNSRLPVGFIVSARWIKPEHRRREGQKVAHLAIKVSGADAANKILRDGMVIRSKRVRARKMVREPIRCMKCQKIEANHVAANCPDTHNTCGTCGKDHRTAECEEKDPNKFKCANCNSHSHASWGRECPEYQRAADRIRQHDTEVTYWYIPTEEPWTW
ncbi:hypothetical protein M422DRAFT_86227, partial [Sphaerobolus stellatus SS14]